jgi:L-asparaginase II
LQKVVRAVELAGEVVEELAKVGQADPAVTQQLCSQFLQTIKARNAIRTGSTSADVCKFPSTACFPCLYT